MGDPILRSVVFHYLTVKDGDDLDHNSDVTSDLRDLRTGGPSGLIIARKDPVSHGTKLEPNQTWDVVLDLRQREWRRSQLKGCQYAVEITPHPNHDKWGMALTILFTFEDGTFSSYDAGSMPLGNHDGWVHIRSGILPDIITSVPITALST